MSNNFEDSEQSEALSDYLGHLLSSVAKARMQADLETLRIAEQYHSHPLLKHFPVPRVRLPKVELSIPVIMVGTLTPDQKAVSSGSAQEGTENSGPEKIAQGMVHIFEDLLQDLKTKSLSKAQANKLEKTCEQLVQKLEASPGSRPRSVSKLTGKNKKNYSRIPFFSQSTKAAGDNSQASAEFLSKFFFLLPLVREILKGTPKPELTAIKKSYKDELKSLLLNTRLQRASRIVIQPQTSKVRESAHEHLSTFKLTVTEDAVEWTENPNQTLDDNTDSSDILVPE